MANSEHTQILAHGVAAWNEWRSKTPTAQPDLSDTAFVGSNLKGANFRGANLTQSKFSKASLEGADFTRAICSAVRFQEAVLRGAQFQGATLDHVDWSGADLTNADLTGADLSKGQFVGTRFENTKLWHITFKKGLDNMIDGSDRVQLGRRDRWLNWARLRKVGQFPLFGISWGALVLALIVINSTAFINQTLIEHGVKKTLPVPERSMWILLSNLLLVVGSTIYRLKCPDRIQTFSETEYVEQHGHPRLLYLAENLNRWGWMGVWQGVCTVSIGVGALLALWLIVERFSLAWSYIFTTVTLPVQ